MGNLQIGGSIQTAEIERGLLRIDNGMKDISKSGKSVGSDFERIAARGKKLTAMFGALAFAGTGALLALAKGAPALAGAMARIQISMLKLSMAVGKALEPAFNKVADILNNVSNWVNEHPNLFQGIIYSIGAFAAATGIIAVGGWVFKAWKGFFGLFTSMAAWGGWATIGTAVGTLATKIGGFFSSAISWFAKIPTVLKDFLFGGASAGIAGGMSLGSVAGGMMAGPLVNTYQRELTGEPGFLDKQFAKWKEEYENYMMQQQLKKWSRNGGELENVYFL